MGAHLSANAHKTLTLIEEIEGTVVGLVQALPRDAAWHVTQLAFRDDALSAHEEMSVLTGLLTATVRLVGEQGGARLYARVERDAHAIEAFTRAGFWVYTYESVYWLQESRSSRQELGDAPIRPQTPGDAWAICQLYAALAPRVVQQAEGRAASDWDLPGPATLRGLQRVGESRWVLEIEGDILGYVRAVRLTRRLQILVHPDAYQYARSMIALGVGSLFPRQRISCCLPEYQGGLGAFLQDEGFVLAGQQAVLVRHVAKTVREEKQVLKPVLERSLEPARTVGGQGLAARC